MTIATNSPHACQVCKLLDELLQQLTTDKSVFNTDDIIANLTDAD